MYVKMFTYSLFLFLLIVCHLLQALLGGFFHIQAVALFEDIPLDHSQFHVKNIEGGKHLYLLPNATDVVTEAYDRAAL